MIKLQGNSPCLQALLLLSLSEISKATGDRHKPGNVFLIKSHVFISKVTDTPREIHRRTVALEANSSHTKHITYWWHTVLNPFLSSPY